MIQKQYDFASKEAQYQEYTLAMLTYALADARKTVQATKGMECEGYYLDDMHTIAQELNHRRNGLRKEKNFDTSRFSSAENH